VTVADHHPAAGVVTALLVGVDVRGHLILDRLLHRPAGAGAERVVPSGFQGGRLEAATGNYIFNAGIDTDARVALAVIVLVVTRTDDAVPKGDRHAALSKRAKSRGASAQAGTLGSANLL
jgi:hypothetical protein